MAVGERRGIIRFCETPKDKGRIMTRLGLNEVQADSYLVMLTRQSMLIHDNGRYITTLKGQDYVASHERIRKLSQ
jgi:predicted transcriptional regulator